MDVARHALSARPRGDGDVLEVVSWIPDAASLRLFTGPRLRWPLTVEQLTAMESISGLSAWVVDSPEGALVGHFDLLAAGDEVRLGRVIVNPALRGQRRAGGVIDVALAGGRAAGARVMRLNVISDNVPAVRTYLRAGFTPDSSQERPGVTSMSKQLL